jgi:hypothetical protein
MNIRKVSSTAVEVTKEIPSTSNTQNYERAFVEEAIRSMQEQLKEFTDILAEMDKLGVSRT